MTIGVDIDGVLASFEHGFAPLLTQTSGIDFPDVGKPEWPPIWDWDKASGASKDQIALAYTLMKASPVFWRYLPAHKGASSFLTWLSLRQQDDVYFITHRSGKFAKHQTERWLKRMGYLAVPTVIMSANKGDACKLLKVDFYIDDKDENIIDVMEKSPATFAYMMERPYNHQLGSDDKRVVRGSLDAFRQQIEATK